MTLPGRQFVAEQYRYSYQGAYAEDDPETGYHHFEARDYDSRIGRWLVPDPMGQHWSPYLAMSNNWINVVDPDGMFDTGWNWLNKTIGAIPGFTSRTFAGGTDVVWTGLNMNLDWHVGNFFRANPNLGDMVGRAPNGLPWIKSDFTHIARNTFTLTGSGIVPTLGDIANGASRTVFNVNDILGGLQDHQGENLSNWLNGLGSSNANISSIRVSTTTTGITNGRKNSTNINVSDQNSMSYSIRYGTQNISVNSYGNGNLRAALQVNPNRRIGMRGTLNAPFGGTGQTITSTARIMVIARW